MRTLNEAIKTYREKNYAKALALFEKAGAIYGANVVEANIFLCKKALGRGAGMSADKHDPAPTHAHPTDREARTSGLGSLVLEKKLNEIEVLSLQSEESGHLNLENLVVVTASCTTNIAKRRAIEATWGKQLRDRGVAHYFVIGVPTLTQTVRESQTLYVPCRDDYESLLLKLALAYEYVLQAHAEFTHVFKIDDDCYLNLDRFAENLLSVHRTCDFVGGSLKAMGQCMNARWHFGKCSDPRFDVDYPEDKAAVTYAEGGYGYLLSRRSLMAVVCEIPAFRQELAEYRYDFEDVRIAKILAAISIEPTALAGYEIAPPTTPSVAEKSVVFDIANPRQMHRYHQEIAIANVAAGTTWKFPALAFGRSYDLDDTLGFDHVYVVNLRSAVDRRVNLQWRLNKEGIRYEIFNAFDGAGELGRGIYNALVARGVGNLVRFVEFAELEKRRGRKFIESPGAVGYILTYVRLLLDAKSRGFRKVLVLEDDIMLRCDLRPRLASLRSRIPPTFKVLLLGASQYNWSGVDPEGAKVRTWYTPTALGTCGSFAMALDISIVDELVDALLAFDGPFDHIPLGQIYRRYSQDCYVAFPNLIIPDVSTSYIREGRDQVSHSKRMLWDLEAFDYPSSRIRIGVVFGRGTRLVGAGTISQVAEILCYRITNDGIRPVHPGSEDQLNWEADASADVTRALSALHHMPVDRLYFSDRSCSAGEILSEVLDQPLRFGSLEGKSREWLLPVENRPLATQRGFAAVIIPTRGRHEQLVRAIQSVLEQDWPDKEVLVVDENDSGSECQAFVRKHVDGLSKAGHLVRLITHSRPRNGAAARNTGIFSTRAEYISFLDDDDAYLPGRLSKVIRVLQERDGEIAAAYCGYLGWNSKSNDESRYPTDELPRRLLNLDYQTHYVHTNTVTYRREALVAVNGFDESFIRHQDLEFNIRIFDRYFVGVHPEILVELNPLPADNANKQYDVRLFNVKIRFLCKFEEIIGRLGLDMNAILSTHVREMKRYVRDPHAVREFALRNPSRFSSAYLSTLFNAELSN